MGQAYAYKIGELKSKDIDPEYRKKIKDISKSMSKKDLRDYASTKHKKLPEEVSETKIYSFKEFLRKN